MKILNFSIIKLCLCIVVGILLGNFLQIGFLLSLVGFAAIAIVFVLVFIRANKMWLQDSFFGVTTYLLFIAVGILTWQLQLPKNNPQHFSNRIQGSSEVRVQAVVREVLKSYTNYDNYIVEVYKVNDTSVDGKLLLKIRKDSLINPLNVDERVAFKNRVTNIPKPLNPHQFDYSQYMSHQKVLGQSELRASELFVFPTSSRTLKGYAHRTREHIVASLKENGFKDDELGIIKALLLGQKDDISRDTYNNYAAAGVVHILAVSGLHVGIILAMLQFILSPLIRFKNGRFLKMALIVTLLWAFAVLAGLSPSVVRAVTMFSFYAIALNLKRRTSTINVLFMSAMVLLLINPEFLFTVGFQLSYLAVFSIVMLQPVLYSLIKRPKYFISRLFWGVFTVTLAAQVGVLPLSLFYFHQFPGLFFITNVAIIPFLGFILSYGTVCIVLALLNILPPFLAIGFQIIIQTMNNFIGWVSHQEAFLFRDIHFSEIQTLAAYVLIVTLLLSLRNFKPKKLIYILLAFMVCQLGFIYEDYRIKTSKEFVVFHQTAETALGYKLGDSLVLQTSDLLETNTYLKRTLNNYKIGDGYRYERRDSVPNVLSIFNKNIFILDSLGVYDVTFKDQILLLRNSPKVNLNRLIDSLAPKLIIADGSNYKTYVKRWKATAERKKLPFHHTGEKGAFLIKD